MQILRILFITLISTQSFAQAFNQKTIDEKKHSEILIGYCNREGFNTCNFDSAYQAEYASYAADSGALHMLGSDMKDITIKVIMGTWCGDSKEQIPRFYKILDLLKFDYNNLSLICVDRTKTAPGIDLTPFAIKLVPTIIFYRDAMEIGRITESPTITLEKDLKRICSRPQ